MFIASLLVGAVGKERLSQRTAMRYESEYYGKPLHFYLLINCYDFPAILTFFELTLAESFHGQFLLLGEFQGFHCFPVFD